MNSFKLELRVYDTNTRRWEVHLEQLGDRHIVENWISPNGTEEYFSKKWDEYQIDDESLEVFVACTGYGGTVRCIVLINDEKPTIKNTIFSNFDDEEAANKSFPIITNNRA